MKDFLKKQNEKKRIPVIAMEYNKEEKEKIEKVFQKLLSRVTENDGMSIEESLVYALMYRDFAPGDVEGPIPIKTFKTFFEEMVKDNPNMKEKILDYYDYQKEEYPEKMFERLTNAIEAYRKNFRTVENIYRISPAFRETAERIAPKLDAPKDMSIIERVKWLRVWMFIIRDQHLYWRDMNEKRQFIGNANTLATNRMIAYPETLIYLEKIYFSYMPENQFIILDMIKRMISLYPKEVQEKIIKFGEFKENVPDSLNMGTIRNDIKRLMFPAPWCTFSSYFCTTEGIKAFDSIMMKTAIQTYLDGGIEKLSVSTQNWVDVYNLCNLKKFKFYRFDNRFTKFWQGCVTCDQELQMYVETYKWLLEHPDFRFGSENKTVAEYQMDKLLEKQVTFEEAAVEWAVENGYAKDIEDVNTELLSFAIPEEDKHLLVQYYEGEILPKALLEKLGLKNYQQARCLCSKTAKFTVNAERDLKDALKRITMFGIESCSKSDNIYLKIFKHMMKNCQTNLPKTVENMYGKKLI